MKFNGVKVFAATMYAEREVLGERVTEWMARNPTFEIADIVTAQSSDNAFHCISITLFYNDPAQVARVLPPATTNPVVRCTKPDGHKSVCSADQPPTAPTAGYTPLCDNVIKPRRLNFGGR